MGVRRISVGGSLARVAMDAFIRSAREIAEEGKFDSFAGIVSNAGAQHLLPRGRQAQGDAVSLSNADPTTGQPIGLRVDTTPAGRPAAVVLDGRFGRVEKLDPARHGADLWDAVRGHDALWTYMSYGPFADVSEFSAWLDQRAKLEDPYSYVAVERAAAARSASPP